MVVPFGECAAVGHLLPCAAVMDERIGFNRGDDDIVLDCRVTE